MKHNIYLYYGFSSSIERKIELIKKHRFQGVFLFWDEGFPVAFEKVREAGLEIETVHLPFDRCNDLWIDGDVGEKYAETMITAIAEIAKAEIPTVIFHISGSDNPPPFNELGVKRLSRILRACEDARINLALENLRRLDYLDYVYSRLESDYLKFCFDSGHANAFTRNIENFPWEKYGEKLICVHLHDNNGLFDQHLVPFTGNINWRLLAEDLKKVGYKGPLTSEAVFNNGSPEQEEEFVIAVKKALEEIDRYINL
ncbi:MAG TPA: sugar phosphate isomerase/epimerase family protein [Bacilli bacterium]|nr:sugar phosphate isomerase/epimerase family protein [Bacilli bacterium]HPZ27768.1 sugar phosphate isomerase/epimerase family protein [Bacilli bacterium]